jgi:hypothetical protein
MNTICLSMIIKNHEDVIEETLKNIVKHIKLSYWVICDTGSLRVIKDHARNL